MSLSCDCDTYGCYDYYFYSPKDFSVLQGKERKRCCSCGKLIEIGADCGKFVIFEFDECGEQIDKADKFMCEECVGLFFSLEDLGFCMELGDDMHDLVKEYNQEFG